MRRRGLHIIAVMVDPTSFGAQGVDFLALQGRAEGAGLVVYPVKLHDDITRTLSQIPVSRPVMS
jgi:hypothetical protein